jgi:hypothetical protein
LITVYPGTSASNPTLQQNNAAESAIPAAPAKGDAQKFMAHNLLPHVLAFVVGIAIANA